eukprot:CAMPEP_0178421238 /NCGR_PEP_ID=MMETSP0689_2-20121128/26545_1 /TAXON_ID=160604 /ORGANISM="Amphidinium massartii, Strain CS-259" /LENGTH=48 /DNA_ID= /DNA_START= /DNA_END= /DNA_ORIENTATION=
MERSRKRKDCRKLSKATFVQPDHSVHALRTQSWFGAAVAELAFPGATM